MSWWVPGSRECSDFEQFQGRLFMMTSSNGSIFRVIGHLCGEFTGLKLIHVSKRGHRTYLWVNEPGEHWFRWWLGAEDAIDKPLLTSKLAHLRRDSRWHVGMALRRKYKGVKSTTFALQLRHNERDGVSNHRRLDGLLNRLFRRRS